MCLEMKETRYFDLYIAGSEGTRLCHKCEMRIVQFIRDTARIALRKHRAEFLNKPEEANNERTIHSYGA